MSYPLWRQKCGAGAVAPRGNWDMETSSLGVNHWLCMKDGRVTDLISFYCKFTINIDNKCMLLFVFYAISLNHHSR